MADTSSPTHIADYDHEKLFAIRACFEGTASGPQQQMAMRWIIEDVCRTHDLEFRAGGEDGRRASDFVGGRRFCGQQIVKMLRPETLAALDKSRDDKQKAAESRVAKTPRQPRKSRGK